MKRLWAFGLGLSTSLGGGLLWAASAATEPADVIIAGGTVYNGEDAPAVIEDVVIADDKVVYVGPDAAKKYQAKRTINAAGKIVSPGFIDGHSHPERWLNSPDANQRTMMPWVTQGTTTLLMGIEGVGAYHVKAQTERYEKSGIGANILPFVGFGLMRAGPPALASDPAARDRTDGPGILGDDPRAPTPAEFDEARARLKEGMCEGGWGLSISLFNAPQGYAKTGEIITLAKEAAKYGGIYHVHERDEASYNIGLMGSTLESIRVGREAHIPVQITHIKAIGPDVWGQARQVIDAINKARAEGVNVTADQYPWTAASAGLEGMLVPPWAEEGGRAAFLKRLDDPVQYAKIRAEASENMRRRGGPDSLMLISLGYDWTGKNLTQMGAAWRIDPIDAALRIVKTDVNAGSVASFSLRDDDVNLLMQQPWMSTSSDGGQNHPRLYASYPRKFQKYAVEDKVITVQQFIRSATGLEADFLHLDRRGYLKPGYFADVVVFDPKTYRQKADYVHWNIPSEGVDELFINGKLAVENSKVTGTLAGRTLLHTPTPGTCP